MNVGADGGARQHRGEIGDRRVVNPKLPPVEPPAAAGQGRRGGLDARDIRSGLGLAIRVEICQKDGFIPDRQLTDAITSIGLSGNLRAGSKKRGLILDVGGYYKNVFTIAPSFYIKEDEIDLAVELFEEALKKGIAARGVSS